VALRISPMLEPVWTEHVELLVAMGRIDDAAAVIADAETLSKRVPRFEAVVAQLRDLMPDAPSVRPRALDAA